MNKTAQDLHQILEDVPKDLPFYLDVLTTAGHLHSAGYGVDEHSLHEDGFPSRALIFAPVFTDKGQIDLMFEIRVNTLNTLQMAAEDCGVNYRTIQRWRDEGHIIVFEKNGKQVVPSEIVKEYAAKKGHI